jgi:hypothetical protein
MNERQKQLLIIGVIVVIALILFMRSNNNSTTVVNSGGDNVSLPQVNTPNIIIEGRQPFVLPNFGVSNSANSLSAIGACCADCRPQTNTSSFKSNTGSGITFVTNMGNSGPNVYNYIQQAPPQQPVWFKSQVIMRARG